MVELVGGGSVFNGAYPVYFLTAVHYIILHNAQADMPPAPMLYLTFPHIIVCRLCIQTCFFSCNEIRRLTILTLLLVTTKETIQTSQSEDTFLILPNLFVRT